MESLQVPQGTFQLERNPPLATLRAWDAADEYLLNELAERDVGRLALVGDSFGALAVGLHAASPSVYVDGVLSHAGIRANLERNGVSGLELRSDLGPFQPVLDTVLVKVPKSLAHLEDLLLRLRPSLSPDSVVIGAGMARHIHSSTLKIFERCLGPTRTSLARKKARLIYASVDPSLDTPENPWPMQITLETGEAVINHAGVFSADHLDIGTRFFLSQLPLIQGPKSVIDLGCGNGVVGLAVARANPAAHVLCLDVSHRAVASAQATFAANGTNGEFRVADCLDGVEAGSVDQILLNPPFHDGHAIGDDTAWRMFNQSRAALKAGGELWVVGNRHLGYHAKLKRLFGSARTVGSNKKFVVVCARRG